MDCVIGSDDLWVPGIGHERASICPDEITYRDLETFIRTLYKQLMIGVTKRPLLITPEDLLDLSQRRTPQHFTDVGRHDTTGI